MCRRDFLYDKRDDCRKKHVILQKIKKAGVMAKKTQWNDDYWLLLIQEYLRKPVGVKGVYSRGMVNLALELHIPPQFLYSQMFRLRQLSEPRLERLWRTYSRSPKRLQQAVERLRQMKGFGLGDDFYDGVETNETFERDFRPLAVDDGEPWMAVLMPVHLIVILDRYFRLTPTTMVAETPDVKELAKMIRLTPAQVVEVMDVFKFCDPILHRDEFTIHPLLEHCQAVWDRYGNGRPEELAATAAQMQEFFEMRNEK